MTVANSATTSNSRSKLNCGCFIAKFYRPTSSPPVVFDHLPAVSKHWELDSTNYAAGFFMRGANITNPKAAKINVLGSGTKAIEIGPLRPLPEAALN